jgi:hypothetical protein
MNDFLGNRKPAWVFDLPHSVLSRLCLLAHLLCFNTPEGTNLAINPLVVESNSQILIARVLSPRLAWRPLPAVATDGTLVTLSDPFGNVFEWLLPRSGL